MRFLFLLDLVRSLELGAKLGPSLSDPNKSRRGLISSKTSSGLHKGATCGIHSMLVVAHVGIFPQSDELDDGSSRMALLRTEYEVSGAHVGTMES